MANTSGIASTFKVELLQGVHVLSSTGTGVARTSTAADVVKAALFTTGATISPALSTYTSTGELPNGSGYATGGLSVTTNLLSLDTTTAIWQPSAAIVWTGITFNSVDTVMFYNSTVASKSIGVYTFSSQSITSGTFTLTMPTFVAATALLRIS